jgi:hypothetical protein
MPILARAHITRMRSSQTPILTIDPNAVVIKRPQSLQASASSSASASGTSTPRDTGDKSEGQRESSRKEEADGIRAVKEEKKGEEEDEMWWEEGRSPCCGKGCQCVLMKTLRR